MHKLTEKIYLPTKRRNSFQWGRVNKVDSIITEFLESAAKELKENPYRSIREILGLEEAPALATCSDKTHDHSSSSCRGPKYSEVWCNHIRLTNCGYSGEFFVGGTIGFSVDMFQFCPICGTRRPQKKSLREELAEKLASTYSESLAPWSSISKPIQEGYLREADCAIEFLRGEVGGEQILARQSEQEQ